MPRVLAYEQRSARRRRWPVWVAAAAWLALSVAAPVYHVVTMRKPRWREARGTVSFTTRVSLASQLRLYAEHHSGNLPPTLERLERDERGVCYMYPGSFRRVPTPGSPYPVYAFLFQDRPFLCEYLGAGVTTDSHGAVVFRWLDGPYTRIYAINEEGRVSELHPPAPIPPSTARGETAGADTGGL